MTYEIKVIVKTDGRNFNKSYIVDEYEFCKKGQLDAVKFHKIDKGGKTRYTWIEIPNAYQMKTYYKSFKVEICEASTGRKIEEVFLGEE